MYAKIENGTLVGVVAGLPKNHGNIAGFDMLSDEVASEYGFLPMTESKPALARYETYGTPTDIITATTVTRTYPVITPDLAESKSRLCAEVDKLAAQKRNQVVGNISPYEAASWPIKLVEAQKFSVSSLATDAPNLGMEAMARGVALGDLVQKVLAKSSALAQLEAGLAGINGRHSDAINALATVADVQAYDITVGWPV